MVDYPSAVWGAAKWFGRHLSKFPNLEFVDGSLDISPSKSLGAVTKFDAGDSASSDPVINRALTNPTALGNFPFGQQTVLVLCVIFRGHRQNSGFASLPNRPRGSGRGLSCPSLKCDNNVFIRGSKGRENVISSTPHFQLEDIFRLRAFQSFFQFLSSFWVLFTYLSQTTLDPTRKARGDSAEELLVFAFVGFYASSPRSLSQFSLRSFH